MKRSLKISLLVAMALLPVTVMIIYGVSKQQDKKADESTGEPGDYIEVDWRLLRELDLKTGSMPPELAKVDGKFVKVPGFVVPLDDDDQGLSEFLLVPSPQACIHVPAPPPNQMVMVHMRSGAAPKRSWGAVWIKGRLHIATSDSQYGKISFKIRGDSAERYQMPN